MEKQYQFKPGQTYPSGSIASKGGVNFSIFSRNATSCELLLFKTSTCPQPFQTISLDQNNHSTFYSWHIFVIGLPSGTWYNWRIDGENTDKSGLCFDRDKLLIDPWAKVVSDTNWDRWAACQGGDNQKTAMRCMVTSDDYDWQGDQPLAISGEKAIIYELHIGGYTKHPSAKVKNPGTFLGLIEKIPYLKKLGITHVELLPVMAFDRQDVPHSTASLGLQNYWGYSTHSFFSPHPGYCTTPDKGTHIDEFRDMVRALHCAGIGVILDVVYNHTAEAGSGGPSINFRGIGGSVFYHHDRTDRAILHDYTGCGNTVNANNPLVSAFIVNSLEYWVNNMHVDGFRFDLASALARGEGGDVLEDPPVLWSIELSRQLSQTKLIAEAWDAAGLYQVGSFPGHRWAEWNGKYRDVLRQVLRGDGGIIQELATRIAGSSDLYQHQARLPINSINFITCHDGFTLYDLFSYNDKHNEANGEENRDGCNNNISYNNGVEGDTSNPQIIARRRQQVKNAFAVLLLSEGVPMLLAGDDMLHTQGGNNNCYCQDNELSWLDWDKAAANPDIFRFVQQMIALRKRHSAIMRRRFLTGKIGNRGIADIAWHGARLGKPLWDDPNTRLLAFTLAGVTSDESDLYVAINMSEQAATVELPPIAGRIWHLAVDTQQISPLDIACPDQQIPVVAMDYQIGGKTVLVLENKPV